jgi:hypothetical protein
VEEGVQGSRGKIMNADSKKKLRTDEISAERDKGNVIFYGLPDMLVTAPLEEIVRQPADGILYDLNRSEEVCLSFIDQPTWVNSFASGQVIRKLVEQRDAAERELAQRLGSVEKMRKVIEDCQALLTRWIVPDSAISDADLINSLLGILDGPQSREALDGVQP